MVIYGILFYQCMCSAIIYQILSCMILCYKLYITNMLHISTMRVFLACNRISVIIIIIIIIIIIAVVVVVVVCETA